MAQPDEATLRAYCSYLLPGHANFLDQLLPPQRGRAYALLAEGLTSPVPPVWTIVSPGTAAEHWLNQQIYPAC